MSGFFKGLLASPGSRAAYVTNVLAFSFAVLTFLLAGILIGLFGWAPTTPLVLLVGVLFLSVIVLSKQGYATASRLVFCLTPIWFTFLISILGKFAEEKQSYIIYFDARFILLVTSILPAIVFEFKERVPLIVCLASTFFCLIFFDPVHNLLGVGYYQRGFDVASYYYINYITFVSFVALLTGIFVLKWRHWKASDRAFKAIAENSRTNRRLHQRNEEMQNATHELEAQNEEILQQQEEMVTNQEMLEKANLLISQQKQQLQEYSQHLEKLVEEKSGDLLKANEELIKSNNELRQFSFTVSHNLRGPVARLLGLTRLMDTSARPEDVNQITTFIQQSASELDSILRDLTTIIDIRSELYRVREKINIHEEWSRAVALLGKQGDDMEVHVDFDSPPYVFAIRPMVQSILYNLAGNAIKYRSPERKLILTARSRTVNIHQTVIEVGDNGLGIDLTKQGEHLFKLYKRFHLHVAGKGMGLYLVRSQMEIMNGRVEVESEPDRGTLFRLVFPVPSDLDKQVFFENDSAQLYYDAHINNTVIIWKKNVTSEEYRKAFDSVLLTIRKYNTPGWIADLRNQGVIAPEDQKWFVNNVLRSAADNGLKRIGTVGFLDPVRVEYYERMKAKTQEFGIELRVFEDMDSAVLWMKSSMEG